MTEKILRIILGPPNEICLNIFKLFILVLSSIQIVRIYWGENCFLCLALKVGRKCFEVVLFFKLKKHIRIKFWLLNFRYILLKCCKASAESQSLP